MQKITTGFWSPQRKILKFVCCGALCLALFGCFKGSEQVGKGKLQLKKVSFSSLPGWSKENFAEIIPVFSKNCAGLKEYGKKENATTQINISPTEYEKICERFAKQKPNNSAKMKKFIEKEFAVYQISDGDNTQGKFTSYYEAEIKASFEKSAKYKYPVYGKPKDLVEINLRDFGKDLPDSRLVGRVENGRFVPYYKRNDIENKGIDAPIIMWGDDLVDIHFMQIQGSAVAHMDDGSEIRIGYADNNGHKFKGIGSILTEKKLIKPGEASMPKIREWLRKNPEKAAKIMAENERFVFQRLSDADGPVGAFGISLTAGRSLAVDNGYIPLGAMLWLDTKDPDKRNLQKIVFAQDIGGAIKGVVRGDYFWGHGEEALKEAGRMNSAGGYYIFVPQNTEIKAK